MLLKIKKLTTCFLIFLIYAGIGLSQGTEFWVVPEEPKPVAAPPAPKPVSKPQPKPEAKPQPVLEPKPEPPPKPVPPVPVAQSISDVLLLMDISGSMDAAIEKSSMSKLESAQKALIYFAQNMKEGTRFQLWTFSAQITQHPSTPDQPKGSPGKFTPIGPPNSPIRQHLEKTIQGLKTEGGTNLYQAIYQALNHFNSSTNPSSSEGNKRYKVMVVLSDGEDDNLSPINLPQVLELKKQHPEIDIKTIGFGIAPQSPFHQTLCQLASSPQTCILATQIQELQQLLHSLTRS